jgi:hypothetical protein
VLRPLAFAFAFALAACSGATDGGGIQTPQAQPIDGAPASPPEVQTGEAHLNCTISATRNGAQKLEMVKGVGLEFDVTVSPIVDGTIQVKGPAKGGAYRFTSHLVGPGKGALAGIGPVTIDELETKVNVEMNRYDQPGGPGTELTFSAADMASRGIYIEFAGTAHRAGGERYAFRVTLGQPGEGSGGKVTPDGPGYNAPIQSKMVVVVAPATTVVTTTTLHKLP